MMTVRLFKGLKAERVLKRMIFSCARTFNYLRTLWKWSGHSSYL